MIKADFRIMFTPSPSRVWQSGCNDTVRLQPLHYQTPGCSPNRCGALIRRTTMPGIHSVAVFCGSRLGVDPAFAAGARALGRGLAAAGMRLVYGGGRIGLMGAVAD